MDGERPRTARFTDVARAAMYNFRMVLALVIFVPLDAVTLQEQVPLLTNFSAGLAVWLALLVVAALGVGRLAAGGGALGEVFAGEVGCMLGLFLVLLHSAGGGTAQVGRTWNVGFLVVGLGLCAFGVVRLFRLVRAARAAETGLP